MMKLSIIRLVKNLGDDKKLLLISIFTSKSIFTEGDYSKSFYIKPSSVNPDALIKIYESLKSDKDKKDFINQMSLLRSNDRISEMLAGSADRDLVDYLSDDYKLKELHSLLKTISDKFGLQVEGVLTNADENHRIQYITEMRDNFQVTDQPIYGALYNIVELDNKGKLQAGDIIRTINGLECIENVKDGIFITCDGNKYNMNEVERVVHDIKKKVSTRTIVDNMTREEEIELIKNAYGNYDKVYINSSYNISTCSFRSLREFDPSWVNKAYEFVNTVLYVRDEMKADREV